MDATAIAARLAAITAAIASVPQTDASHPFQEHAGRGCAICGKARNGKAHTDFHKAVQAAKAAALADLGL